MKKNAPNGRLIEPEPIPSAITFVQSLAELSESTLHQKVRREALGQLLVCIREACVAFNDACDYGLLRRHDGQPARFEKVVRKQIGVSCVHDIFRTLGIEGGFRFTDGRISFLGAQIGEGIARPCLEELGQKLQNKSWRKAAVIGDKVKEDGLASLISEVVWHLELVRTDRAGDVLRRLALVMLSDDRRKAYHALGKTPAARARSDGNLKQEERERARDNLENARKAFLRPEMDMATEEAMKLGPPTRANAKKWTREIARWAARGYLVRSHLPPGSQTFESVRRDAQRRFKREVEKTTQAFLKRYGMTPDGFIRTKDKFAVQIQAGRGAGAYLKAGEVARATGRAQAIVDRLQAGPSEGHWVAAWAKEISVRMKSLPRT